MPRQHSIQSSFLSGVLDPRANARTETDAYNNGLLRGVNVIGHHLGGMQRRYGQRFRDTLPNQLTRITGQTITAPEGGTTANANDDSEATLVTTSGTVGTDNPFIVLHYDLGSARSVLFADVRDINASGGSSTEFRVQYSTDDAAWVDFGDAFELVDTVARSYARGSTTATSARYWRVVKVGGTNMGAVTISVGDFNLWTDAGTVSEVRLLPFEVSTDDRYLAVLTDRRMGIYQNGALVVWVPSPYESADLADIDAAQNQDSMVLVHEDYPPMFLFPELGTFYTDQIAFTHIPQVDFDDADSPTPTSEVQVILFGSSWAQGDTFQIDLMGAKTGAIVYAGDSSADERAATASNIAREVQKLYTVRGFTGVSCARTNTREYTVTFAGASADTYELMTGVSLSTKATSNIEIVVAQTTPGVTRTEDAWSATRGYPRTVTFYEGRLYFGGTPSLAQTVMGSKVNQILDFEVGEALTDDGIFTTLANQQLNGIQGMCAGRALQFFTTGGEFRYVKQPGSPIEPGDAPANQTSVGGAKIRPVVADGATIFVNRTRKAIRDFRYDYEEDAYTSLGLSSLAPHLLNNVARLGVWNGAGEDEISLVFVVNGDGTMAVLNIRREAEVRAWTQFITKGQYKDAAAVFEDMFFAVRRVINGTAKLFLEQMDRTLYTDCAVQGTEGSTISIEDVRIVSLAGTYRTYVDTTAAHGLAANDILTITGVVASGDYNINGVWVVETVIDDTTVLLRSQGTVSPLSGTYVSGGGFASGASATFTGLTHLNGEECRVRADGSVLADNTPSSGSITLEDDFADVEVGLNFNPDVTPMNLLAMTPMGVNAMRKRRISNVHVRVYKTLGLYVNGNLLPDRRMDVSNFDGPVVPVTGVFSTEESTNWDETDDKLVSFTQVDPLPMHILGIDVGMEWNE